MSTPIDELVKVRRGGDDASGKWGLALSGGGIRSATFCFGLLAALSRGGLLQRFDLLSTVSGGGYIGSLLGRLMARVRSRAEADAVYAAFGAREPRWFAWWVRANGRYLVPGGAADGLFAATMFVRNLIAVHLELGALALLLGAALASFDLLVWWGLDLAAQRWPALVFDWTSGLSAWWPTTWLLLLPLAGCAGFLAAAYWVVPWVASGARVFWHWSALLGFAAAMLQLRPALLGIAGAPGSEVRAVLLWAALALCAAWLVALPLSRALLGGALRRPGGEGLRLREAAVRRRLTDALVWVFRLAGVVLLAGLIDRAAWFIAFEYRDIANAGLLLALLSAALRAFLPALAGLKPGGGSTRGMLIVGRAAGYLLTFLLCAWWVSIVHLAGLGAMFGRSPAVEFAEAEPVLAAIGLAALGYLLATGRNFEFLNLSSLHTFYRARLVRSYLGAANPGRFGSADALGAIQPVIEVAPAGVLQKSVFAPDDDDDIAMDDYAPHRFGGPVHLVNACVNQTRDPRGGLFNRDRRGQLLTVAPGGLIRVGVGGWQRQAEGGAALSLGTWVAISGAAVAPGLGQDTRGGLAALVTFAGLRLGYWWSEAVRTGVTAAWKRPMAKSIGLLRETFGCFEGAAGRDWFLSDGGHFENTGVLALLAEQAAVIVVADCGADPDYAFGDLENLVRKARIDLGAEIRLMKPLRRPVAADAPLPGFAAFGALGDLASRSGQACLAVAEVEYRDGTQALMIIVKPNLTSALPVDLLNFAAGNPEFPQQTTADQFFDEAQWESYHQLGSSLGGLLTPAVVDRLRTGLRQYFEPDAGCALGQADGAAEDAASSAPSPRLPGRLRANVVTASIGVGGLVSIAVPVWHEVEKVFGAEAARIEAEEAVLKELGGLWSKLPPPRVCSPDAAAVAASAQVGALAEGLLRSMNLSCEEQVSQRYLTQVSRYYGDAVVQCELIGVRARPRACVSLLEMKAALDSAGEAPGRYGDCGIGRSRQADLSTPMYWAWLYAAGPASDTLRGAQRHPGDPMNIAANRFREELEASEALALSAASCPVAVVAQAPQPLPVVVPSPAATPTPVTPAPAPTPAVPNLVPGDSSGGVPDTDAPPAATPAPARPASVPVQASAGVCAGKTIYIQIHGPALRELARSYREPWRALGASVPPIEDVVATAQKRGRSVPQPVSATSVRFHDAGSRACAEQLEAVINPAAADVDQRSWKVTPLASSLRATPGVIEVWLAP